MTDTVRRIYGFGGGASDALASGAVSPEDRALLGGKGSSLHALTAAGLPVPPGFTIATHCCKAYYDAGRAWPPGLRDEVADAMRRLETLMGRAYGDSRNPLLVSVRSGAAESMPGMMDTRLNVGDSANGDPQKQLDDAIVAVWDSWESERAVAYRREKGVTGLLGTAVTVQAMCPSQAAGVLFTADPATGDAGTLILEAAPGLGEAIVSGRVTPERVLIARDGLAVRERQHTSGPGPVLDDARCRELAGLALRAERLYGHPLDIEWGWDGERLWLLQARAIAGLTAAADRARLRAEAAADLRRRAAATRGPAAFCAHNLGETLPAPTPMTWDLVSELMSGRGGYGRMYRDLGFTPSAEVDRDGFLVLVLGRVYADLGRAPELFFGRTPMAYDLELVRRRPEAATEAPTRMDFSRAGPLDAVRTLVRASRAPSRVQRALERAVPRFRDAFAPAMIAWVKEKRGMDLATLSLPALRAELDARIDYVLREFGREWLKPSLRAGLAFDDLQDLLERALGAAEGRAFALRLCSGLPGDSSVETSLHLSDVAAGRMTMKSFLEEHGHRAAGELELSTPRWREDPSLLARSVEAAQAAGGDAASERHDAQVADRLRAEAELPARLVAAGNAAAARKIGYALAAACMALPWRETAKDFLMRGYETLRLVLLEIDHRLGLDGGVFFLDRAALDGVVAAGGRIDDAVRETIRRRRAERRAALAIELPEVLDGPAIDALERGEPPSPVGAADGAGEGRHAGMAVASGTGAGSVWVCRDPGETCPVEGRYVLVCASTDPGMVPLFRGAAALVMERGGTLSHGAIVARDFGIPCVILRDATRLLRTGDRVRVDGGSGLVALQDAKTGPGDGRGATADPATAPPAFSPGPEPYVVPRPAGFGLKVAAGVAAALVLATALFLVPGVPEALSSLLDLALAPLTATGSPFRAAAVAAAAAGAVSIALQLAFTDRARMRRTRRRLDWYADRVRDARKAGAPETADRLGRRRAAAGRERLVEMLLPVCYTAVPLCIFWMWVDGRFDLEPLRPGQPFRVDAVVRPDAVPGGTDAVRFARLEAPPGVEVRGGEPWQRLRPSAAEPGAWTASWTLAAAEAGERTLRIAVRGCVVEKPVIVTASRCWAAPVVRPGGLVERVEIGHAPARAQWPPVVTRPIQWLAGTLFGRALGPGDLAVSPVVAFLILVVLLISLAQRLLGLV